MVVAVVVVVVIIIAFCLLFGKYTTRGYPCSRVILRPIPSKLVFLAVLRHVYVCMCVSGVFNRSVGERI